MKKLSTIQVKNANYHVVIFPKSYEDELHLIGVIGYNMQMKISV